MHLSLRMARFNAFGASGLIIGATYMLKYREKFLLIIFGNVSANLKMTKVKISRQLDAY